jgi:hypothetical protein
MARIIDFQTRWRARPSTLVTTIATLGVRESGVGTFRLARSEPWKRSRRSALRSDSGRWKPRVPRAGSHPHEPIGVAGANDGKGVELPRSMRRGKVRNRRISPVAAHSSDRLRSEPTTAAQPSPREPLFMPPFRPFPRVTNLQLARQWRRDLSSFDRPQAETGSAQHSRRQVANNAPCGL